MATEQKEQPSPKAHQYRPAWVHIVISGLIGVAAAIVAIALGGAPIAALVGWDAAAVVYVIWTWLRMSRLDAADTAQMTTRDDSSRPVVDLILLAAGIASLVAVGFVIVHASHVHGTAKAMQTIFGVGSVVVSWVVVHLTYTLRYATMYYGGDEGGIGFNQDEAPRFHDFAYIAFTIGMTFQVSDTDLKSSDIRATALRHALLSYLYGTVIIAAAINLVAGLAR